jgi:GT2 family glycosyltransferase
VAYHSGAALVRCLDAVGPQADEVIVVDNGGGDELAAARAHAGVRVVGDGRNIGFAAGCNVGKDEARGQVLVFLNPDTVAAEGAIEALAAAMSDTSVGVAMARLRLLDRPQLLNSGGNVVHISGLAWAGRFEQPAETVAAREDVPYASGAALAVRRDLFERIGGFTDELFMYQEDLELCWRARLSGLRIVIEPGADVYHEYEFARNTEKRYFLERNRLIFVLTAYPGRLLLAAGPVLLGAELALVALAMREGWLGAKVKGWAWIARHPRWLARHRKETMRLRRVGAGELARFLTPVVDPQMIALPRVAALLNAVVSSYWRVARHAL